MKRAKMISLMVLSVLVAVAVIGTNLASTTALCKDEPKEGACGKPYYTSGISGEVSSESVFETSIGNVVCASAYFESSLIEGPTGKEVPLKINLDDISFGCKMKSGTACTVKTNNKPYLALLKWTSGSNGELKIENSGKGTPTITFVCGTSINCTYNFEVSLDFQGGSEATLVANSEKLGGASGTICPGSGAAISWSATYQVFEPLEADIFVANNAKTVTLCKKNETPCPGAETYGPFTSLGASLEAGERTMFKLKIIEEGETEYTISCESSSLEGNVSISEWPLPASITALKFEECGGTCSVSALSFNYNAEIEATGSGNGTILFASGKPKLRVKCISAYKCTYEFSSLSTSISGGAPANLSVSAAVGALVVGESDKKCGSQLKWAGTYKFTKPEAGGEAKMWVVREGV